MSDLAINGLPLPHALKLALHDAGYKLARDVNTTASDLSAELGISLGEAETILRLVSDSPPIVIKSATAADLLSESTFFSTSLPALDGLLSQRGLVPGMTVELSSPPGGGKTAMVIALALAAAVTGEVLLIDTEGSINPAKLRDAAGAPELLERLHLMRVATQAQMIALLHTLDEWLQRHPRVHLVAIDTLSFHFRQPGLELKTRRRIMDLTKQKLAQATAVHRCAMIITSQLATKLLTAENKPANFDTGDRAVLMPQLGDLWTTASTVRMVLFRGKDDLRYAHAGDEAWARFDINTDGLPCE